VKKQRPTKSAPRNQAESSARPRGRPPVISNEQLLSIARDVFLELGIRATTAEVAKRAGIAEGTLFHRFASKEELFRAAMRFDPEDVVAFIEALPTRAGSPDLRATLIEFAEGFVDHARVALPVMMMSWSNPEGPFCGERGGERQERKRRVLGAVSGFFEAEMSLGRIEPGSAEVLARMLLGSLYQFCMGEMLAEKETGLSAAEFARGVVDVLLAATARTGSGRTRISPAQRGRSNRTVAPR
jgi:AcrR family transcriptional regulator